MLIVSMTMNKFKLVITIIFTSILCSCTIVEYKFGEVPNIEATVPNNYQDVLASHGAPDSIATVGDNLIFTYHSVEIFEPQLGLVIPSLDLFKYSWGRATATHTYLFYAFSSDGSLLSMGDRTWNNDLGNGSAFGVVFVVDETVDMSVYEEEREVHLWGKQLLVPVNNAEETTHQVISGERFDLVGQSL